MLILHNMDGDEHLFAPEHINTVGLNMRATQVTTSGGDRIRVRESQEQVALLRTAWRNRYDLHPHIDPSAELIWAVAFDAEADDFDFKRRKIG